MLPIPYLRQLLGSIISHKKGLVRSSFLMPSKHLERDVMVEVYRPAVPPWRLLQLAIFNDGQDLPTMEAEEQLTLAYQEESLKPTLVIGIHAGDRIREYGTVKKRDYVGRGNLAPAYEKFLTKELLPWIIGRFNVYRDPSRRAIAGFSLGGLSALDIAWRNASRFGVAGVFSGSLWYRHRPFRAEDPDADRIVHDYVLRSKQLPQLRYWFMAGTQDEEGDRNNNGIIDAIDDTIQLMGILQARGQEPEKMTYVEVPGGRHEPATWKTVFLDFLRWI